MINETAWRTISEELKEFDATLVAVSKTKPIEDILKLYALGQRDFGENYVQELVGKATNLPENIRWHFIGHLQSNKVKYIAPFVHLIHGVDGFSLLKEINKQAKKYNRIIDVLLQVHVASEETKFGLNERDIVELMSFYEAQKSEMNAIRICGLMGMATNTDDEAIIRAEFAKLRNIFLHLKQTYFFRMEEFSHLSMGMSSDYKIALEEGSTMLRVGSMLFGAR